MLDSAAGVKDRAARDSICIILASAALRYRQLDSVAAALVNLLNKHEHMAGLCAELAQYAVIKCDDAQLVRWCLGKVVACADRIRLCAYSTRTRHPCARSLLNLLINEHSTLRSTSAQAMCSGVAYKSDTHALLPFLPWPTEDTVHGLLMTIVAINLHAASGECLPLHIAGH